MFMRFILFLSLMLLSFQSFSFEQDVLLSAPKKVKAGDDFVLIVNIPTNLLRGISRLQLDMPNGFEVKALNTENSKFKYENQIALFQWLQFPVNKEVEITMNVNTPNNISGYFVIKANAFYLANNEPVKINIEPKIITVESSDNSEDDMLVLNEKTTFSYAEFKSEGVACIRQVPYLSNDDIIVNVLVIKGNYNKYGKIQEKIPVGYKVANIKSQNAIFVYNEKQRTIKYMWMNMPDKEKFVVSYKLTPTQEVDENNPFLIYGNFHYADNKNTISVEIKERGIDLENLE